MHACARAADGLGGMMMSQVKGKLQLFYLFMFYFLARCLFIFDNATLRMLLAPRRDEKSDAWEHLRVRSRPREHVRRGPCVASLLRVCYAGLWHSCCWHSCCWHSFAVDAKTKCINLFHR
jgi:hypothetical protein